MYILAIFFITVSSSIQKQLSPGESPHKQEAHWKKHTDKETYEKRKWADVFR